MKTKLKYCLMAIGVLMLLCSFRYSNREGNEIPGKQQIEIIYFHGHSYVCYRFCETHKGGYKESSYGYGYGGASIVHDPDCKCHKNKPK